MSTPIAPAPFVPQDLDPSDWSQLEPLYRQLLDRPIRTREELDAWLADFSALYATVAEYGSRKSIAHACHTDDPQVEKEYLHYVEQVSPKLKPMFFKLQQKLLAAPAHRELDPSRFTPLVREWRADVEVFREENVPLQTKVTKLVSEYDKLIGAMIIEFRGKSYTPQQLGKFLEEPDRQTRQEAWELVSNRRMQDAEKIDDLFEKMLALREEMARNAGFDNYRDYTWKARGRFDYTPQDCLDFASAIEETIVPAVERLDRERREELKLDSLRPWDLSVDPKNRPPLRPFDGEDTRRLVDGCRAIFSRLSPQLAEDFGTLRDGRNLDLRSRKGKRAGGFQASLELSGEPFIFMNAAGLQRDVETMLHEGGHAFHFMWATRREPLVFLRHSPLEFAEVASMGMEAMCADGLSEFYPNEEDLGRAKRSFFEGIIRFLPWMATIDLFQHWIYTHPNHTRAERTAQWLAILDRFGSKGVDWSGYEGQRATMWHRQLHLFHHPFYYIEYGIAQLGALQLWTRYREDREGTLRRYRDALALGGTRSLPELFEAAGLRFAFDRATLQPLVDAVTAELDAMPA